MRQERQALKQRLMPADVAKLALFLASDDARVITSQNYSSTAAGSDRRLQIPTSRFMTCSLPQKSKTSTDRHVSLCDALALIGTATASSELSLMGIRGPARSAGRFPEVRPLGGWVRR